MVDIPNIFRLRVVSAFPKVQHQVLSQETPWSREGPEMSSGTLPVGSNSVRHAYCKKVNFTHIKVIRSLWLFYPTNRINGHWELFSNSPGNCGLETSSSHHLIATCPDQLFIFTCIACSIICSLPLYILDPFDLTFFVLSTWPSSKLVSRVSCQATP